MPKACHPAHMSQTPTRTFGHSSVVLVIGVVLLALVFLSSKAVAVEMETADRATVTPTRCGTIDARRRYRIEKFESLSCANARQMMKRLLERKLAIGGPYRVRGYPEFRCVFYGSSVVLGTPNAFCNRGSSARRGVAAFGR